jgi:hypothetical protein
MVVSIKMKKLDTVLTDLAQIWECTVVGEVSAFKIKF